MSYYGQKAANADKLLRKRGTPCVITRRIERAYNTATGQAEVVEETRSGYAVMTDQVVRPRSSSQRASAEGDIQSTGRRIAILSAVGQEDQVSWWEWFFDWSRRDVNIEIADRATIGGRDYMVEDIEDIAPGGVTVLFRLTLRGV